MIKVIYLLIFVLACILVVWINFDSVGNHQIDYKVVCNYGNKDTFIANKDKGIYFIPTYYDYSTSLAKLPDETKLQLQKACGLLTTEDVISTLSRNIGDTSEHKKLFDLTQTKVNITTHWTALGWSVLSIFMIFIISEIIKRAFYYIVLGKIKPQKQ